MGEQRGDNSDINIAEPKAEEAEVSNATAIQRDTRSATWDTKTATWDGVGC